MARVLRGKSGKTYLKTQDLLQRGEDGLKNHLLRSRNTAGEKFYEVAGVED